MTDLPRDRSLEQANRCLLLTLALEQAVLHDHMHETEALFLERARCLEAMAAMPMNPEARLVLKNTQVVETRVLAMLQRLQSEVSAELCQSRTAEKLARNQMHWSSDNQGFESTV